ncbi:MAG: transposase [Clostridia bacterium]|nr:transposase [Clostridia bacterium]
MTQIGKIVEKYLLSSENIQGVKIDEYVIMPDHIHAIIFIGKDSKPKGTSRAPSPTNEMLPHIVSTFKRFCNKEIGYNIFQRSFADHIIRDREDYETRRKYIHDNPIKQYYENKKDLTE